MKPNQRIRSKEHWKNIEAQVKLGKFDKGEFDKMKEKVTFADLPEEETMIPMSIKD